WKECCASANSLFLLVLLLVLLVFSKSVFSSLRFSVYGSSVNALSDDGFSVNGFLKIGCSDSVQTLSPNTPFLFFCFLLRYPACSSSLTPVDVEPMPSVACLATSVTR